METLKFNSTIKCTGCLATVTPYLDETAGANNWEVDLTNPNKVLTVKTDGVTAEDITKAVESAGYSVESIN
ncbi:heavy-metal-associated domain-containing protein [Aegicerativicinus sediminis]|uniref:heavy-metal-associated domain-containing protein n=1 Tax=Aegicerativicinus sediminis TaxID=2893202 RepID=UPI001E3403DE|nr:heavy-metal-associated domain-containing protein [Aegicerativicinus sediminis]